MSFVIARPAGPAAQRMTTVADVSASATTQFSADAATYRVAGAPAMAVHELFTATLCARAGSYAVIETANTIAAG